MFCGIDSIMQNIPTLYWMWRIFRIMLLVPQNIISNLNNVMYYSKNMPSHKGKVVAPTQTRLKQELLLFLPLKIYTA